MSYTLNQAAKATRKSKSTISTALKKGKITATKGDGGSWIIDPAELHRVYPAVSEEQHNRTKQNSNSEQANIENMMRIKELETKLDASVQHCRVLETHIDDLKEDRDTWRQQATALLTDQRPRRRFWEQFTGRKS